MAKKSTKVAFSKATITFENGKYTITEITKDDSTDYKRFEGETDEELIYRITGEKDKIGSWQGVADILNELLGTEYTESKFRKQRQAFDKMFAANQSKFSNDKAILDDIAEQRRELAKERVKLQTEKLEYNRWLREEARDELITEKICDAVNSLIPLDIPKYITPVHNTRAYALVYGDEHFGVEYELKGLFGDIINAYSPEIFEERMWDLFHQTVEIIQKENIDTLNVFNMGDFNDGILRVSQLMKLRYGVVDGTIKYADFIANWLNELTKFVRVKYQSTNGNHSELRLIGQPKGTFTEDNMGKVVTEFIKTRLKDNPNFTYIENPTGFIYAQLACNTVLGIHGEVKNMKTAIDEFSRIYNVPIQYLLAGHLHHNKTEEIGVNSEVINVGSIIGVDSYSLSLRKTANASAKLLVFEQTKGKVCEYTLKLN